MKNRSDMPAESGDSHNAPVEGTHISKTLSSVKGAFGSLFTQPKKRRQPQYGTTAAEVLENRELMTSGLVAADATEQSSLESLYESDTPVELSRKTPHFVTDFTEATPDNPVTVNAQFTFNDSFSSPSILIAQTERANHRNSLREAIYVQIQRDGNGYISQFLGSDANESTHFTYDELAIGSTADIKVTYDGTNVSVTVSQNGNTLGEESYTPPVAYNSAKFGFSNIRWDSDIVSATMQHFEVTRGKEMPPATQETATEDTEAIDAFFVSNTTQTSEQTDTNELEQQRSALLEKIQKLDTAIAEHGEQYREGVTSLSGPLELSRKTPHFTTDYLSATPENPVVAKGTFTLDRAFSNPSILIAQTERANHRNGLREAIYVQIGRNGIGAISQFLGSDDNRRIIFEYGELPIGATIDIEVTYDGTNVTVKALYEGTVFTEQSFTPPNSYARAKFGISNLEWDSSNVTATAQSFDVAQGEFPSSLGEQRAELANELATLDAEIAEHTKQREAELQAIDDFFSDATNVDNLLFGNQIANVLQETETLPAPASDVMPVISMTDTPEERLAALAAKKEYLQERINKLDLEKADLETQIAREDARLAEAARMDGEMHDIMQRWEQQMGMESQKVVPSVEVETYRLRTWFDIEYKNLPEGYSLTMDECGEDFHFELPAGSGSVRADMPRFGRWGSASIYLVNPDGQRVAELLHFNHTEASSPSKSGAGRGGGAMPQLAYVPELDASLRVSNADKARADAMQQEIATLRADATTKRDALIADRDVVQGEIDELERQKIPYSQMHVSAIPNSNTFAVHYMSNTPETYFVIGLNHSFRDAHVQKIEHPAGEADGYTTIDIGRMVELGKHGDVEIRMYADAEQTILLDSFSGGFGQASGKTNGEWGELETGRIVDTPYQPTLSIVDISGPNLLVAAQSPYDSVNITMDGGGYFAHATMTNEGGMEMGSHIFTFNTDMPAGRYSIWMREGRNNMVLVRQEFMWDPTTGQISLIGQNPTIRMTEGNPAGDVMHDQLAKMDIMEQVTTQQITVGTVRNAVQAHLYEHSKFVIDPDTQEADLIANSIWAGHPDADTAFRRGLGDWEAAIRECLQDAALIAQAAWCGESPEAAKQTFLETYGRVLTYDHLRRYMMGYFHVQFPSANELIDEGIRLAQENPKEFVDAVGNMNSYYKKVSRQDDQEGPHKVVRSDAAIRAQLNSIQQSSGGTGSVADRMVNYVASLDGGSRAVAENVVKEYGVTIADVVESVKTVANLGKVVVTKIASDRSVQGEGFDIVDSDGQEFVFGNALAKYLQDNGDQLSVHIYEALTQIQKQHSVSNEAVDTLSLSEKEELITHIANIMTNDGSSLPLPDNEITGNFEVLSDAEKSEAKIAAYVSSYAYNLNESKLTNALESLGTSWKVVDAPALGITNGSFTDGNATVVFVTGVINGKKTLVVGFKGTDSISKENTAAQNWDAIRDIFDDVVDIDNHINSEIIISKVRQLTNEGEIQKVLNVGHSLGGAMAQKTEELMEKELIGLQVSGYTFGSPGTLGIENNNAHITNILHNDDLVPYMGATRGYPQILSKLLDVIMVGSNYKKVGLNYYLKSAEDISLGQPFATHSLDAYINSLNNW